MSIRTAFLLLALMTSGVTLVATAVLIFVGASVPVTVGLIVKLLVLLVVLMILAIILGYVLAQPQRRRLYEIEEAASLLAAGRLTHRVTVMGHGDEIDSLGMRFNEMGAKLQEQVKMLQDLAAENQQLADESERSLVLEERQRLARELHDSVSQQLFALTMLSATALRYHQKASPQLEITLEQINQLASAAQREMRALLLHLRPVELAGRSLEEACEAFLAAMEDRHHLTVDFSCNLAHQSISDAVEEQLFRILQEAVANVVKHAQAEQLTITITSAGSQIELTVLDDGVGIGELAEKDDSYGIKSMRERAAALGGTVDVWARSKGTGVRVSIPIFHREEEMEQ